MISICNPPERLLCLSLNLSLILSTCVGTPLVAQSISQTQVEPRPRVIWPGWLGPNRNGWVKDFQPPEKWPKNLVKRWTLEVGTGYGSPLLQGTQIYQHARQGEEEVLWCVDLKTGKSLWHQSFTTPFKIGGGGEWHGKGPKSSPVMADGRIFTMSINGDLTSWDAETGEQLWRSNYRSKFKSNHPYWGASTSPIVDGDKVIVHLGTDENGLLVALDVKTGQEIWSLGNDGPSYSSPLIAEIKGVRQLVEWNHRALVGVDLDSGRLLWDFPFPHVGTDQNMPTPVVFQDRIFVGGENRGIYCVDPQRKDGTWTVKTRWHQKRVALDMSSALINDTHLYGFSHYNSGQFFCLDPETGEVLWLGPGRTGKNVMFLAVPGFVVALIDNGQLNIIAARDDRYESVASYRVSDNPTWAPPVLFENKLLVKDSETLTLWEIPGE